MAYAKCPDCGAVWRYRATKGSRVRYQVCPVDPSHGAPVGSNYEEFKEYREGGLDID